MPQKKTWLEKDIPIQATEFPHVLKTIMEQKKIKPGGLATRLGVDPRTIYRYLSGKTVPDYYMMARLADALDILPTDLYSYSNEQKEK